MLLWKALFRLKKVEARIIAVGQRYKRSTERIGRTQKSMLLVNLDMKLNKFLNRYLPEGMVITGIEKGCRSDSILARLTSLLDGALLLNAFCEAYSVFQ